MTYEEAKTCKVGDRIVFKFRKDCVAGWGGDKATITVIHPTTNIKKLQISYECNGIHGTTTHDRVMLVRSEM